MTFLIFLLCLHTTADAAQLLELARADGYDFVTTSLPDALSNQDGSAVRTDVTSLESRWWSTSIVGNVVDPLMYQQMQAPAAAAAYAGESAVSAGGDSEMRGGNNSGIVTPMSPAASVASTGATGGEGGGGAPKAPNHECLHNGSGLVTALSTPSPPANKLASRHLKFMVDWAGHMSIPAVILPGVVPAVHDDLASANYARLLSTLALEASANNVQLWVRIPATEEALRAFELLHSRCDHPANLGCMLCFDSVHTSPSIITAKNVGTYLTLIHKLVGCNLRAVSFSTDVFLTNKRGYPTLSKSHQILFGEILRRVGRTVRVVVEGLPQPAHRGDEGSAGGRTGCAPYLQYLRHVRSRPELSAVLDTEEAVMETSYLDHLQSPLQPLGDNLEFQTYETFEKDPVKYARYEDAVRLAVRDGMSREMYPKSGSSYCVNIMVVGAGRGPLVQASLDAIGSINSGLEIPLVKVRITAVEKNNSAVIYLRSLQQTRLWWKEAVTVVEVDMRHANTHPVLQTVIADPAKKADIVVSELLGSFGDNELSPECLDGAERCGLMKDTCVSIPQNYTAYLAPVSSMRLYTEAQAQAYVPSRATDGPMGKPCGTLQAMETPYVVRTHAASQTHAEQPCWAFSHPHTASENNVLTVDNERSIQLVFGQDKTYGSGFGSGYGAFDASVSDMATSAAVQSAGEDCGITIHGFLGSFHSTLYQPMEGGETQQPSVISIAPSSFSVGMFSWFPLYFPLREPLYVPNSASVSVSMWRKGSNDRVWYEWCAEVSIPDGSGDPSSRKIIHSSPIHNPNGRSYFVRL